MQKNKSKTKLIFFMLAMIISLCAITGGLVLAKYFTQKDSNGYVTAKNFYFTSNFLDGKVHTIAPGINSITFNLSNHDDDLRYSEVDIAYTVEVTNGATITNNTGILKKGNIEDTEVTISNLNVGTYNITATGTGGYVKKLTATIVISEEANIYYYLDNSSQEYTTVTVWNEGDKAGTVTITYKGIPDNTNPNMIGWMTNSSKQVTINPHESIVLRFFSGDVFVDGATLSTELGGV